MTYGERFWSKVEVAPIEECWNWLASLNNSGYGQFAIDNRPHRAHRIAWEELRGEIPAGLVMDHLCRNRACVNPWHLEPVTHAVNIARGSGAAKAGQFSLAKTHCPSKHPYDETNTRLDRNGHRRCRICERTQSLAGYYKRKAAAP